MAEIPKAGIFPTFVTKVSNLHRCDLFALEAIMTAPRTGSDALEEGFAFDGLLVQMLFISFKIVWELGVILDWEVLGAT